MTPRLRTQAAEDTLLHSPALGGLADGQIARGVSRLRMVSAELAGPEVRRMTELARLVLALGGAAERAAQRPIGGLETGILRARPSGPPPPVGTGDSVRCEHAAVHVLVGRR